MSLQPPQAPNQLPPGSIQLDVDLVLDVMRAKMTSMQWENVTLTAQLQQSQLDNARLTAQLEQALAASERINSTETRTATHE
jgi:hypothetical protein